MRPGLDTLRALPLFASFDEELLLKLNDLSDLARIGPGEVLFTEGDPADQLYILQSGYVTICRMQADGGEALTDIVGAVRPLAFATVLLDLPAQFGAKTVTSCRVVMIPTGELRAIIDAKPLLCMPFLDYALTEARELELVAAQLKLRPAAQRLAEYLLGLIDDPELSPARFVLPYEKRFLAGKIGCSQENLSRAFAALRRIGVDTQQGVVVVRDVGALRDFARIGGSRVPSRPAAAPFREVS